MSVHLYKQGFSYLDAPKCGSTSLKHFFFEIENGFEFRRFHANGRARNIHNAVYPARDFASQPHRRIAAHTRVAVVRDPVGRLLSCYGNRVLGGGDLDSLDLTGSQRARGMTERPDLATFVRFLPDYRALSPSVAHHSQPLSHFLGTDPDYYSRVFGMGDLDELVSMVAERVGDVPNLGRMTRNRFRSHVHDLTEDVRTAIEVHYAEDIQLFGAWM
ncbi:sulfotransferase family protein [Aliiruegeria haliotis]|uniref:Sulfotransferase family protein n=1 Tax=Aliiruegeria haliotis TaxID=1280846 RepID=A0A2T0RSJ1_9RHOB|nr:sulfotransferase family 2 domain-containing protein [Aliiruegeria haliotis]PRY24138.1 sulfotransferase family protein [Aliiruegeria haliotis]